MVERRRDLVPATRRWTKRVGKRGVIGINLFYRDVQDLIEVVNTGEPSATAIGDFEDEVEEFLEENPDAVPGSPGYPEFDPNSFVYTAANVGDGYVYGVELDMSTPLTAIGMPDTGVFVNYSWLDSSVDDAFGERRFNNQAKYAGWSLIIVWRSASTGERAAAWFDREVPANGAADEQVFLEDVRNLLTAPHGRALHEDAARLRPFEPSDQPDLSTVAVSGRTARHSASVPLLSEPFPPSCEGARSLNACEEPLVSHQFVAVAMS